MNLAQAFAASARKHPAKTALCWSDREIPYAELHAQSLAVAAHLQSAFGVQPGDRVAVWVKNCPEFVPAVFGILAAGGVVVPVNNFLKPAEVAFILQDSGAVAVITDASLAEAQEKLLGLQPGTKFFKVEEFAALPSSILHPRRNQIWPRCSTPRARRGIPRARCSRTAISFTTSRAASPR